MDYEFSWYSVNIWFAMITILMNQSAHYFAHVTAVRQPCDAQNTVSSYISDLICEDLNWHLCYEKL